MNHVNISEDIQAQDFWQSHACLKTELIVKYSRDYPKETPSTLDSLANEYIKNEFDKERLRRLKDSETALENKLVSIGMKLGIGPVMEKYLGYIRAQIPETECDAILDALAESLTKHGKFGPVLLEAAQNLAYIVEKTKNISICPDTLECNVLWGQAYRKAVSYGKSIGIELPVDRIIFPAVMSCEGLAGDRHLYLRPDADLGSIPHELFHKWNDKVNPNTSGIIPDSDRIVKEGLARWFEYKSLGISTGDLATAVVDLNYPPKESTAEVNELYAPYDIGHFLIKSIEDKFGTAAVLNLARKYDAVDKGLNPIIFLLDSQKQQIMRVAIKQVYKDGAASILK
jgi:hypothetical protein